MADSCTPPSQTSKTTKAAINSNHQYVLYFIIGGEQGDVVEIEDVSM